MFEHPIREIEFSNIELADSINDYIFKHRDTRVVYNSKSIEDEF